MLISAVAGREVHVISLRSVRFESMVIAAVDINITRVRCERPHENFDNLYDIYLNSQDIYVIFGGVITRAATMDFI
jgi:hypothetical protein